jgi:hypothetical protein
LAQVFENERVGFGVQSAYAYRKRRVIGRVGGLPPATDAIQSL